MFSSPACFILHNFQRPYVQYLAPLQLSLAEEPSHDHEEYRTTMTGYCHSLETKSSSIARERGGSLMLIRDQYGRYSAYSRWHAWPPRLPGCKNCRTVGKGNYSSVPGGNFKAPRERGKRRGLPIKRHGARSVTSARQLSEKVSYERQYDWILVLFRTKRC